MLYLVWPFVLVLEKHWRKALLMVGVVVVTWLFSGCHSRLLGNGDSTPPAPVQEPTEPSNQNLPVILGFHPVKSKGWLPVDGQLLLEANQPTMIGYIYQGGAWSRLSIPFHDPSRSIVYDGATGVLKYTGFASNAYFLVYQWLPD